MKFIIFFVLLYHIPFAFAQQLNIINPLTPMNSRSKIISTNNSVMSCGVGANMDVYSSIDVRAILAISNSISDLEVPLQIDWSHFRPQQFEDNNKNQIQKYPDEVRRMIFLCLTWNETNRLKLFYIPDVALNNVLKHQRQERPWKIYSSEIASRIDNFTDESLKEFIYIVMRANVFTSVRGGLDKNPSLWTTSFNWRTPLEGG